MEKVVDPATLPPSEALDVEFKGGGGSLSHDDIVRAVVCLANTCGGTLYLGIEDDGRVTGLPSERQDAIALAALIRNRTHPPCDVVVEKLLVGAHVVLRVLVPRETTLIATQAGVVLRRHLKQDGQPECRPVFPGQWDAFPIDAARGDYSATVLRGTSVEDFDPRQLLRLQERASTQKGLKGFTLSELLGSLDLVREVDGQPRPTVTGLLLVGRAEVIARQIPCHGLLLQHLKGTRVVVNEARRDCLLECLDILEHFYQGRVDKSEIERGLQRIEVPSLDYSVFREVVVNALVHRDYATQGEAHVQWQDDCLVVSSPGGFVEGVTIDNLLTVHSKPRNMRLAMAMVRLGYAERSGRGVDRAFEGSLRFGRLAPDYSQTTPSHVSVTISTSAADLGFFRFILEAEAKRGKDERLSVYELSILAKLRLERELSAVHLGERLSLPPERLRGVIERLVEEGLISPKGHGRGRVYLLSKDAYDALGRPDGAHDRQVGQTEAQLTQAILDLLERSPWIARRDLIQTLGLEKGRAGRLLTKLANAGLIRMEGKGKGTKYMKR